MVQFNYSHRATCALTLIKMHVLLKDIESRLVVAKAGRGWGKEGLGV